MNFIRYNDDGEIICVVACNPKFTDLSDGNYIKETANQSLHYVDVVTKTRRDKRPIISRVTIIGQIVTLYPLPKQCSVTVDVMRYNITDGSAEINFTLPGKYKLRVEALHRIPRDYEVEL